jgi:MFS family permease
MSVEVQGGARPGVTNAMLSRLNVAAGFAAAYTAITSTALNRYGQTLQLSPFAFGLLAALPFATALAQIPASFLVERYGGRRKTALLGTLVHRAVWLVIAAVPWLVPRAWWWLGLLAFLAASHLAVHAATPAAIGWVADLVPARLRGRYFSLRGQIARVINVLLCLGVGWLMDYAAAQGADTLRLVISVMLAAAAVIGMLDPAVASTLPDPWHRPKEANFRLVDVIRRPLADRSFRALLGYTGFLNLATGFVGPFVWLYLVEFVGCTNTEAVFMTMVGSSILGFFGMRFWGPLVDRWGAKRTMLVAGLLVINGATTWLAVTPTTKWIGYPIAILSAFAWPAMELAGGNLLFAFTQTQKDDAHPGSAYAAINSAVIAISGTLSGLLGGLTAQVLKGWHGMLWGIPLTSYAVLFIASAVIRIFALLCLFGLKDDRPGAGRRQPASDQTHAGR